MTSSDQHVAPISALVVDDELLARRNLTVLLRDAALVAGSVFLVRWPRSRFSADGALGLDP